MEARISGTTKLFGLIGSPVSHSASPAMQNYGFQACGVDGAYLAFDIKEEEVPEFIKSMRLLNIQGCNVTMPNKTAAAQNMDELSPAAGSVKDVKRVGRGHGSGNGKTAGKGHKGQNARSGGGVRIGFEGGQMPIARRIPKRGFKNIFGTDYAIVNVADLNQFAEGTVVDAELLKATGLVKKVYAGVKVLGNGELTTKLTVKAAKFSKSAVEKIEKAGGKAEVM